VQFASLLRTLVSQPRVPRVVQKQSPSVAGVYGFVYARRYARGVREACCIVGRHRAEGPFSSGGGGEALADSMFMRVEASVNMSRENMGGVLR